MNIKAGLAGLLMLPMAMSSNYSHKVDLHIRQGSFEGVINPGTEYKLGPVKLEQPRLTGTYVGDTVKVQVRLPLSRDHHIHFISDVVAQQAAKYAGKEFVVYFNHKEKDSTVAGEFVSPDSTTYGSFNVRYWADETLTGSGVTNRLNESPDSLSLVAKFIPVRKE